MNERQYVDHLESEIERLKRIQPCGHPRACIVSSDEGTNYCGWCADLGEIERLKGENAELLDALNVSNDAAVRFAKRLRKAKEAEG